ncbi:MAG: metallophosphoesterase family protein [Acidimicrobiia bacterium]
MIRVAALGDCHVGADTSGRLQRSIGSVNDAADVLLVAGDLTKCGTEAEARLLVDELRDVEVPICAVLGNHDHHGDEVDGIALVLKEAGVRLLEGDTAEFEFGDTTVGIAGTKGFGGGFAGASGSEFGEPEMKAFIRHTKCIATSLRVALTSLTTDFRVALLHYAPIEATLDGERCEIYPFLGSYLLAEAIDTAGADLVLHGHAHGGQERGATPGGTPVRNVAQPVIGAAYRVYTLGT